jgi:transcription antitermination factor NusG
MHEENGDAAWYAIRTRSRHEKVVDAELIRRGLESFLPLVERRRRWADRYQTVSFPLFPGYCFARFPWEARLSVLTAVGAAEILGLNGRGTPVPDTEIEAVRLLVTSVLPFDPHPYLEVGMEVEVVRGPLEGVRGLLICKGRHARLVIAIHLICQAASVELDAEDVQPIGRPVSTASRPTSARRQFP